MELLLPGAALLTFLLFAVPARFKNLTSTILILLNAALSSGIAIQVLSNGQTFSYALPAVGVLRPTLVIDSLSALFILVLNVTVITGILYSRGYLQPYLEHKGRMTMAIHHFSFVWLQISMSLVCMFRDGFSFLLAWELMSISSFMLVMFDAEDRHILRTAINYLIQMHIGMILILAGFLVLDSTTGNMSFDALSGYFANHPNMPVFVLFFIGFAIKAGFIPFHTWLPEAHPAAPSHVSGVMSGVMIKMGIYGILRVTFNLQNQLLEIGCFVLVLSVISGLYGVMLAILQRDLKKMLAYSSIENIGIIGIGIGVGILGMHDHNQSLILLGFSGALLHLLNHSLFKSLLFYSAGSVYKATHTRNMEQLGGLMKNMPKTALLFLLGTLAICGLPPFNGFISEFLVYNGLFSGLQGQSPYLTALFIGGIVGLALIGGLAVFCFTRAFGITFLGTGRSEHATHAKEISVSMLFPKILAGIGIICIGLVPAVFVKPVSGVVSTSLKLPSIATLVPALFDNLWTISLVAGILVLLAVGILLIRYRLLAKRSVTSGPTWCCGYTAIKPSLQYTSTSFTGDFTKLIHPLVHESKQIIPIQEDDIFPETRTFSTHTSDNIKNHLTDLPSDFSVAMLRRVAVFQTGKIQHYVLYSLMFMLLIFILSFFNIL
ncbi:MAG: proton-conducting transporter membrane subunit [Bacteroidota bacterium]|nr:proton-conducting transporter membrane subunit [Bacteroidota bacterium]